MIPTLEEQQLDAMITADRRQPLPSAEAQAEQWRRLERRIEAEALAGQASRLRGLAVRVLVLVLIVGAGLLGWAWTRPPADVPSERGTTERADRILIVGEPDPQVREALLGLGLRPEAVAWAEAEAQGRALDSDRSGVRAILEHADEAGFGYVVLRLDCPPDAAMPEVLSASEGANVAAIMVGDLGRRALRRPVQRGFSWERYHPAWEVTWGDPASTEAGPIVEALFVQPVLGWLLAGEVSSVPELQALQRALHRRDAPNRVADLVGPGRYVRPRAELLLR